MKKLTLIIYIAFLLCASFAALAQDVASNLPENYKSRNPLYDYTDQSLNNTDTIPDFEAKAEKLKITGTVYQSDGKTPAKDVILYIFQADENGNYNMKRDEKRKRFVYHRAWVKTDANGTYTFYTFMPGKMLRTKELKQIHRIIKEPGKEPYNLAPYFFNDDPLIPELTLACRANAVNSMLRIEKQDGMLVATKDIKLGKTDSTNIVP